MKKNIEVKNAYENNLKNIDVDIPYNSITVITGVSGSGKSSLAFDTIYSESERIFLDSIYMNMKMITDKLNKPKVEVIKNLLPSISIGQKYNNRNPRSTVGTVTDLSKYIRVLFSRIGNSTDKINISDEGIFSFNNPKGWCTQCKGTGETYVIDKDLVIDYNRSLDEGAISFWETSNKNYYKKLNNIVFLKYGIRTDIPFIYLSDREKDFILYGISEEKFKIRYKNIKNVYRTKEVQFQGVLRELNSMVLDIDRPSTMATVRKFLEKSICPECSGKKLNKEVLSIKIGNYDYGDVENFSIMELKKWMNEVAKLGEKENNVVNTIINNIYSKINLIEKVGLDYISLSRSIPSLSGGEIQRLRLANQLGCTLSGLLYILDEPTMGLHIKDIENMKSIIKEFKYNGNTLIIVEHNLDIISEADYIIDMGPTGGENGGYIISKGNINHIKKDKKSITGKYLNSRKYFENFSRNRISKEKIYIKNAIKNNLKNEDFRIPLGVLVGIVGVSGSGKSTLINDILVKSIEKKKAINCEKISGIDNITRVIVVDQSPIGRTPKSNIATYTGVFDYIRDIYSKTSQSKSLGFTKGDFSLNTGNGRCDKCNGEGKIKIDMSFMPDTYMECEQCKGKRYKENILKVTYKGYNISEVLEKSVDEVYDIFKHIDKIEKILACVKDIGLGYLKLGQSAMTFSGGEAQRIKLATYLSKGKTHNILYVLDEPSCGLHIDDIQKLIKIIQNLVDTGNSVILIEHNIEIIKCVDYIIELGKGGGPKGGKIISSGTINEIKKNKNSIIGRYL